MIQKFTVNDFEGPLDLLLHLIRSSKMDIYNINVESITKQYIDFINESKDMSIDLLSEYLVMASELLHLKSKLLLGKTDEEEEGFTYIAKIKLQGYTYPSTFDDTNYYKGDTLAKVIVYSETGKGYDCE